MKKILLSLIALLVCVHAYAQDECCYECCSEDCGNAFYAEIFGGANFLQTEKNSSIRQDYNTGFIVSGSLGYRWCNGLRLEAEYAYRRNCLSKLYFFGRSFSIHGHFNSSSYMANLLWDVPLSNWGCNCWNITPFIGGGIGYDVQKVISNNEGFTFRESKNNFAWQIIAGLGYPIFCNTDLSVEYKFHKGGFKYIYSHSIGVGLTYKFGY